MCGIVGIVPRSPAEPERLDRIVRRMAGVIVHRGPDEDGFHVTPHVALGVRRLSIIDVQGSHQPIRSADGRYTIVFNGEIYNFRELRAQLRRDGVRFETEGDAEVALRAFEHRGDDGLRQLEGMFAFAVWDDAQRRLTVVRDWFGQKPLFWAETEVGWAFASEIKALLASGLLRADVDLDAFSDFLTLRCLPGEATLFRGVRKLEAARRIDVEGASRRIERLWRPRYEPKHRATEAELLDELDRRFEHVVEQHLISERPLGAFLSGGIDSSLIVAYAARASERPIRTFSVGVHEAAQSELPFARGVAQRYATDHRELVAEPDISAAAPAMTATMEEPVDPFAVGVHLVSAATARHVTVALGGDGGDELFAGYDRYLGQQLAAAYSRLPVALRRGVLRPLFRLVPESFGYKSLATKLRWLDRMAELDGVSRYAESLAFLRFPHGLKSRLFAPDTWRGLSGRESEQALAVHFSDGNAEAFIDRMLHADCSTRLAEHLLPGVDRMSMAHSLEVRCPFLDRRVAEYAMQIPAGLKMKSRTLKYMARRLGERHLPHALVHRSKQGFGFPLALWFRGELRQLITNVSRDSRLVDAGIFDRAEVQRLVDEHVGGAIDHNYRLWLIFGAELWYRHFIGGTSLSELEEWVLRARNARA